MKFGKEEYQESFKRALGTTLGSVALFLFEVIQIAVIAAAIVVPIRVFLIQPFIVQGGSMEPNYFNNEYLIVDQTRKGYNRGHSVVFHPPNNESQFYIKRVIGLPGETIEIKDGDVLIYNQENPDGFKLNEEYLTEETIGRQRVLIPEGTYFLMGDNRDSSLDSRNFGVVPSDNIVGKVWVRGLPIGRAGVIEDPIYLY